MFVNFGITFFLAALVGFLLTMLNKQERRDVFPHGMKYLIGKYCPDYDGTPTCTCGTQSGCDGKK